MNNSKKVAESKDRARDFLTGNYLPFVLLALLFLCSCILYNNLLSYLFSVVLRTFPSLGTQTVLLYITDFVFSLCLLSLITNMIPGICLFCLKLVNHASAAVSDLFFAYKNNSGKFIAVSILLSIPRLLLYEPYALNLNLFRTALTRESFIYLLLSLLCALILSVPIDLILITLFFLMLDFPQYTIPELFSAAAEILKKNGKKLLYLEFSFLPVLILCVLSLGIGFLWGIPYIAMTGTYLYLDLMNPSNHSSHSQDISDIR